MNGDVAASDGPRQGLLRPPLPHAPRGINRTLKQHGQRTSNVDWDRSLQQFAAAVSDDLNDLHARFLHENVVTFAAWKRLWKDARMSAAFLVEFWESTPTNTHKTILQQTLDGLVCCIQEHHGEFENAEDVAALIGRVFTMYCAYSVQVGSPKHKIDVDPQAGTALLTINCVVSGVGSKLFPIAAREVRAMMHRLEVQENAFLRCLQGFGPRVRVNNRTMRSVAVANHDLSLVADNAQEENALIHQSKVEQLRTLNDRYQELMSRARAGFSVSGARLGLRRSKPVVSAPLLSHQETQNDGQDLARALTSYMEYKANEEIRRYDRVARAVAARENESRKILELSDDSTNILDLSDRDSVISESHSVMAGSVTSSRRGSYRRRNGGGSEAALVELESDLCADISSDHVEPTRTQSPQKLARGLNEKPFSTLSEISEAESDALADLERELEQSVDVKNAIPEKTLPRARPKRGRNVGIVSRIDPHATASTVKPTRIESTRSTSKRVRSNSVASRLSFADSWAMSSSTDNDELAAIQAELDAIPTLPGPRMADGISRRIDNQQSSFKVKSSAGRLPAATPKAEQAARQTTDRESERSKTRFQNNQRELSTSPSTPRAPSVVSDSSELIAELQAELDYSAEPTTSVRTSTAVAPTKPRRSSRLSSMASETDSNAVEELEGELNATDAALGTVPPPFVPDPAKTTPRRRGVAASKRAAQRTCTTRSNAKKIRLNDVTTSVVTAVRQSPVVQAPSKAKVEQQVFVSGPTAHQESSRLSSTSSDTESDGLAELVAELDTPATVQTSTRVHQSSNHPATRSNNRSTARYQSTPSSNTGASRSATVRSVAPPSAVIPDIVGLRRSARLSSLASDTESDGLDDLMAELESGPLVENTKKSRARVTTTRKQAIRAPGTKLRQNQMKKGPKAARAPRATRQPVSQKVAAKPSTRQLPAVSVNMLSSRRSTRSSSVAFGSESDGLAELEAELQAGHT